jgi:hypothetical protein
MVTLKEVQERAIQYLVREKEAVSNQVSFTAVEPDGNDWVAEGTCWLRRKGRKVAITFKLRLDADGEVKGFRYGTKATAMKNRYNRYKETV